MSETKQIKIELKVEPFYIIEKGKKIQSLTKTGEAQYIRNDITGLMSLLDKFDTTKHTMKDYKSFVNIKDKLLNCYYTSSNILELSIDGASFLKDYLSNVTSNDAKDIRISEFEVRTLVGLMEQFE